MSCLDVWVSSDSAVSWYQLTATAPWAGRWGHGAAITESGVLLVLGGTSIASQSYNDLWASFNGGLAWFKCRLEVNSTIIRGEQAVALTSDERLIVGNGYYYSGAFRVEYADLWVSDLSFNNTAALAAACGTTVPAQGVGLRMANWQAMGSSSSSAQPRVSSSARPSSSVRPSSSSSAARRVSSSSTAAKPKPCPYWADGSYLPYCECPPGSTGDFPDCLCPARYGKYAYVPEGCYDLYPDPDDPDYPDWSPTGTATVPTPTSSEGLGSATIAAIVMAVIAVFAVAAFAYYRFVIKRSATRDVLNLGGGGGGGGGGGATDGRMSLLAGTNGHSDVFTQQVAVTAPPTGMDYYLSQDPQGGHLRSAVGQPAEVQATGPADEGHFRAL